MIFVCLKEGRGESDLNYVDSGWKKSDSVFFPSHLCPWLKKKNVFFIYFPGLDSPFAWGKINLNVFFERRLIHSILGYAVKNVKFGHEASHVIRSVYTDFKK